MGEIQKHHRRSIRLPGYDYSSPGEYFITIMTYHCQSIFGKVVNGEMKLSNFGEIARDQWFTTQKLRENVSLCEDEFVVMPNHIHGIIHIEDDETKYSNSHVGAQRRCAPTAEHVINVAPQSLGAIVRGYKSAVTYEINKLTKYPGRLIWQRNYYEEIITSDEIYARIAAYIEFNPENWRNDEANPERLPKSLGKP